MYSKEKPYYKEWWFWLAAFTIIAIPFVINELYKTDGGYLTMWDADDVLTFYGNLLSFVGTVALGALALFQNIKANNINERLSLLEKERFKLELQPFVLVSNWKVEARELLEVVLTPQKLYYQIEKSELKDNQCLCLSLFFTNTSNSFAVVEYSSAEVFHNETYIENWSHSTANQQNTKLYLQNGDTGEVVFYCSKEKMESFKGKRIKLTLILENRFSEKYEERLDIIVPVLGKYSDKWHVYLSPQNYVIKKYIKKENE